MEQTTRRYVDVSVASVEEQIAATRDTAFDLYFALVFWTMALSYLAAGALLLLIPPTSHSQTNR